MPAAGSGLLEASLEAPYVVVGEVGPVEALDEVAHRAGLRVETVLRGETTPGATLAIAWEELARERPRRFDPGTRILVALEPLPGWSIWRTRLEGASALAVADRGRAFLRNPDAPSIEGLAAVLSGSADARTPLAALTVQGAPALAHSALERLAATPGLGQGLSPAALASLRALLVSEERTPALRARWLEVIAERKLAVFSDDVRAQFAKGKPLAAEAIAAWIGLGNVPSAEQARGWLAREEADVRAAAFTHAAAGLPDAALRKGLEDPVAEVRAAAIRALVERKGVWALADVEPFLASPNGAEGAAAARALGELGAPVVPPLVEKIRTGPAKAARGAVLALAFAGPEGSRALRALADSHEDPTIRALAGFLLGRGPSDH